MQTTEKRRVDKLKDKRYVAAYLPRELYEALDARRRRECRSLTGEVIVALRAHLNAQEVK